MKVDKDSTLQNSSQATSVSLNMDSKPILLDRKDSLVQIAPAQPRGLTNLPSRRSVDLAFSDLTYKVQEGRKNSEYYFRITGIIFYHFISFFLYIIILPSLKFIFHTSTVSTYRNVASLT